MATSSDDLVPCSDLLWLPSYVKCLSLSASVFSLHSLACMPCASTLIWTCVQCHYGKHARIIPDPLHRQCAHPVRGPAPEEPDPAVLRRIRRAAPGVPPHQGAGHVPLHLRLHRQGLLSFPFLSPLSLIICVRARLPVCVLRVFLFLSASLCASLLSRWFCLCVCACLCVCVGGGGYIRLWNNTAHVQLHCVTERHTVSVVRLGYRTTHRTAV